MLQDRIKATVRDVADFPKPGILFKDITPILGDSDLCKQIVEALAVHARACNAEIIAGVESRGFLFGMMLANHLELPFVPIRKAGKLPYHTISYEYDLEYGSAEIEVHTDAFPAGSKVLVHDDLLATGGTAEAAAQLVAKCDAEVAGFSFLIGLSFLNGEEKLLPHSQNILNLVSY